MSMTFSARSLRLGGVALLLGACVGAAGIYGIGALGGNTGSECAASPQVLAAMKPLARGEMAAVLVPERPRKLPALTFRDGEGKAVDLASFGGRTVLLNLWATWCAPCRQEMPALDALQREEGSDAFEVVAVSIDTRDESKPRRFFEETGLKSLRFFIDPTANIFQTLRAAGRAEGMPTSLLIDGKGCEIAYLAGPAEWSSADAVALVRAALGK
jgi:thiol-disulfide isomerase/thioredoxin